MKEFPELMNSNPHFILHVLANSCCAKKSTVCYTLVGDVTCNSIESSSGDISYDTRREHQQARVVGMYSNPPSF